MEIKIEKGIKIPEGNVGNKYPLGDMEIGDSFVVPLSTRGGLTSSIVLHSNKYDKKFITRKISENEVRVWRVK